ncbi:MAG TPA: hypothetical protein VHC63_01385 [Acidimicrobiales bacterium]|nr:hypothetical protein [Acidimicrobiales bacterium]
MELPLVIDCETCVARFSDACSDCVVTFLCGEEGPIEVDASEARVLRLLRDEGLAPDVRHELSA